MVVEISVICLTYNSDINKLLTTLNSVIEQKNCKFEIIIADDGSSYNKFEEVKSFLAAKNFENYKLIPNAENKGIIKNFLSAIKLANGKYIKYISPGDYLYDEYTLEFICEFMNKYNAPVAFGKAVYYSDVSGELTILKKMSPVVTKIYDPSKRYNYCTVLKHIMLYGDPVLGAAIVANRSEFEHYLNEIKDIVVYIEDNTILPLLTLDKKRIYYIDRYILWYEYKSGISTSKNDGFTKKIRLDFFNCYRYITNKYPSDFMLKIGFLKRKYTFLSNKVVLFFLKRVFIDLLYGKIFYRLERMKTECQIDVTTIDKMHYYAWKNWRRS